MQTTPVVGSALRFECDTHRPNNPSQKNMQSGRFPTHVIKDSDGSNGSMFGNQPVKTRSEMDMQTLQEQMRTRGQ